MTKSEQALARRAVACEGWRWLPGMACIIGRFGPRGRVLEGGPSGDFITVHAFAPTAAGGGIWDIRASHDILPDLTDPCTIGGLLLLVRDAWGDPEIHVAPLWSMNRRVGWRVWFGRDLTLCFDGDTEAEALVAALEAAPVRAGGEE